VQVVHFLAHPKAEAVQGVLLLCLVESSLVVELAQPIGSLSS
jgi:hypothetical protein